MAFTIMCLIPEKTVRVLPERTEVLAKFVSTIGNDVLQTSDNIGLRKRTTVATLLFNKSNRCITIGKFTNFLKFRK